MRSTTTIKEVQRLIGRLTAISRFLPKLAEQTQPIVQLLKKSTRFTWTDDCEQIFQKLKTTLTSPPILQKPDTHQPLLVYITTTDYTANAALVQKIEVMSAYFCPHLMFNSGYLIEFVCLKSDLIDNSDN